MEKVWQIVPRKFENIVDQLLYNRGIIKGEDDNSKKEAFFSPDFKKDLHDPFLLKGLKSAVERIADAKENKEKIGIFADYDADGIPGAALLYRGLNAAGIKCEVFIPNREKGYGLSKEGIDFLKDKKCSLIITVDLGIRNFEEAKYCKEIGIDLIITDHHLVDEQVPQADIVINPKQKNDRYPYKDLSGCGVVFKLIQGLSSLFPKEIDDKFLKWNLDLVCISTIADVVPLSGENRLLAKYGLIVIRKSRNLGLIELIKTTSIEQELIEAYEVGFQIAPRINAPGRIDHATKSFELLVTNDKQEAGNLALWLNEKNGLRQKAMEEVVEQSLEMIEKNELEKNRILILSGDWAKGVIGPSASKLVEKFHRPAIIFSQGDTVFTGSARSIEGVNIVDLIANVSDMVSKFGGHKGAAGLSVPAKKFTNFCKAIIAQANTLINEKLLKKVIKIDAVLDPSEINLSFYETLQKFEPFGMQNSRPCFVVEGVKFDAIKFVGRDKNHLSAKLINQTEEIKTIYFNFPYKKEMVSDENKYDLVFTLGIDEWQGRRKASLNIIDLRAHNEK